MTIQSEKDLAALRRIGKIVAQTLRLMSESLRPGITTAELDQIGAAFLRAHGARSAPRLVYNFPGETCISINDEAAHGIPGSRVVRAGDLVNLDVSAELDGYFADTGATFGVPPVAEQAQSLLSCAFETRNRAVDAARAGAPLQAIGRSVEHEAQRCGFSIIRNLGGHGVGRSIHEEPRNTPNYPLSSEHRLLHEGMVIAIEPFLSTGAEYAVNSPDHWTLRTPDGSRSAQFEHTVVVTRGKPIIITQ